MGEGSGRRRSGRRSGRRGGWEVGWSWMELDGVGWSWMGLLPVCSSGTLFCSYHDSYPLAGPENGDFPLSQLKATCFCPDRLGSCSEQLSGIPW